MCAVLLTRHQGRLRQVGVVLHLIDGRLDAGLGAEVLELDGREVADANTFH